LADDLGAWHAWLDVSVAPRTAAKYAEDATRFLDGRDFRELTEDDVLLHLGQLSPAVRYNAFHALRSLYKWAVRRGHVTDDPTSAIPPPKLIRREPRALSRADVTRLRTAAIAREPARGCLIDFLYYTGARLGEVTHAEWKHDRGDELVLVGEKGKAERTLGIHRDLRRSLDQLKLLRMIEGSMPESMFGRSKWALYRWVKEAAADAGRSEEHTSE